MRISAISDIHVRLIGAGLIGGALSRVMNPISGREGLLDSSLIGLSIRWLPLTLGISTDTLRQEVDIWAPVATDVRILFPEKAYRMSCGGYVGPLAVLTSSLPVVVVEQLSGRAVRSRSAYGAEVVLTGHFWW